MPNVRRSVVVGHGSIGARHVEILSSLGHEVAVVSRRSLEGRRVFATVAAACADFDPDYVVIATETARHLANLAALHDCSFSGTVLVEKPLFDQPSNRFDPPNTFIAYNLRFHPLLEKLRTWLGRHKPVTALIHVGQHLSTWRPGRDFRSTYSAQSALGGGALRDLSHELDYALWLFGPWRHVTALGGASGTLGIDADDHWHIFLEFESGARVGIVLSYLDHLARRQIAVTAADDSVLVDLLSGTFMTGGGAPETVVCERNETYRRQHLALLAGKPGIACSFREGQQVLQLIAAIEASARQGCRLERR